MRLLLDAMCGGLPAYLRLCGHDTAYALDRGVEADDAVVALARDEGRTIVTRDHDLAAAAPESVLLREREPVDQLRELAAAGVALEPTDDPERCGRCNATVERVPTGGETPDYAPDPGDTAVWRCRDCGQCFWKGSHFERMTDTLAAVRS
jgi:uncharacterized protein with PIN domain